MRTLCESRHLLAPPGFTLFHDILRIMLRYVHPEIAHKPKYREAFTAGHSLHECANLYGPHCRQSFLLLVTERFREKYVRWLNKIEIRKTWTWIYRTGQKRGKQITSVGRYKRHMVNIYWQGFSNGLRPIITFFSGVWNNILNAQ